MSLEKLLEEVEARVGYISPGQIAICGFAGFMRSLTARASAGVATPGWDPDAYISSLIQIGARGHQIFVNSLFGAEEMRNAQLCQIPNFSFHGNLGLEWLIADQIHERFPTADFSAVQQYMETNARYEGVRHFQTGHFFLSAVRPDHANHADIGVALRATLPMISQPGRVDYEVQESKAGHYILPKNTPGKLRNYKPYRERLGSRVGFEIYFGKTYLDTTLVSHIGNQPNGIGVWLGSEDEKPPGANVFLLKKEDLAAVLAKIAGCVPIR